MKNHPKDTISSLQYSKQNTSSSFLALQFSCKCHICGMRVQIIDETAVGFVWKLHKADPLQGGSWHRLQTINNSRTLEGTTNIFSKKKKKNL